MGKIDLFKDNITTGYKFAGKSVVIGGAMLDGQTVPGLQISLPLATMSRHGLIAGATGTGKTKSLQKIAELLSLSGVPTLLMDIKGDLSGISQAGVENDKIKSRHTQLAQAWQSQNLPVEFLTISQQKGAKLRATVTEFGPVLFSKILELNDTQSGVISLIFKYCDDQKIPLVDLKDFKKVIQYIINEGKDRIEKEYGQVSTSSVGTIMRKLIELEEQGAETIFGERSFDVQDLIRFDGQGRGIINVIRLTDLQTKPKLFSTFMLCLMAEIYNTFPEEGDLEKPKLCIFIDEAHLIFDQASKSLLDQIETIIKLIRSKGIGIYFVTQNPADIPSSILGQLGLKVQHALRAFTANDRKDIKQAAENYPTTEFYNIDETLTTLGMGEAFVTALNEKGNPTPLVRVMMAAPETRMDTITEQELEAVVTKSAIAGKYNEVIDSQSAFEMLEAKLNQATVQEVAEKTKPEENQAETKAESSHKEDPSFIEELTKNTMFRQIGREVTKEITRGIFGMLGLKKRR